MTIEQRNGKLIIAVMSIGLALATALVASHSTSHLLTQQQSLPTVTNRTLALTILSTTINSKGFIEVTFENNSEKAIKLYMFEIGESQMIPLSGLSPGEKTVQIFSRSHFQSDSARKNDPNGELIISAVRFVGGGGEGVAERVAELENTAFGMREQLGLVLSALRTANPEQIESDEDFQSFEARVNGILSQKEAEMSRATKGGRDIFYEQFKAHLRAIKEKKRQESTTSYRQSLGKLLATYEKHYSQF